MKFLCECSLLPASDFLGRCAMVLSSPTPSGFHCVLAFASVATFSGLLVPPCMDFELPTHLLTAVALWNHVIRFHSSLNAVSFRTTHPVLFILSTLGIYQLPCTTVFLLSCLEKHFSDKSFGAQEKLFSGNLWFTQAPNFQIGYTIFFVKVMAYFYF